MRTFLSSLIIALATLGPVLALEPVAVVSVASVERVLEDVDQISEYGERPALARFVRSLVSIANELKGVDRETPLRLEFLLPEEPGPQPQFRLIIPITSEEQVRETISRVGLELFESGDHLRLRKRGGTGEKNPLVVFRDGCLIISPEAEALTPTLLPVPREQQSDITFRIEARHIPGRLKQALLDKLHTDVARDRSRNTGGSESERAVRMEILALAERSIELAVEETQSIEISADLMPAREQGDGPGVAISAQWNTVSGGTLSRQLQYLKADQRFFAVSSDPQAAASLHVCGSIPPRVQPLLEMGIAAGRRAVRDELEKATDRQRAAVMGVLDVISRTFEEQHAEFLIEFLPANERMVLVAGAHAAEGNESAEALKVLLPEVEKSNEVDSIQMGVASVNGVEFHRLQGTHLKPSDERLYGPKTSAYLGAGSTDLWIVLGEPAALDILPYCVGSRPRDSGSGELAHLNVHVRPWLHFVGDNAKERQIVDALRQNFPENTADSLNAVVTVEDNGLAAQIELDRPFLKLLATLIAARAGR